MQKMTQFELMKLLQETNHNLTIEDFDDIAELDSIADKIVNGQKATEKSLLDCPTYIAGYAFYPVTIAKDLYWNEFIVNNVKERHAQVAFVWMMNQPTCPEIYEGGELNKSLRIFARRLEMTEADIRRVFDYYKSDTQEKHKSAETDYGDLIAVLMREYGQTWDYWLNATDAELTTCITSLNKKNEKELESINRARVKSGKAMAPPIATAKDRYVRKFRLCKERIAEKWQKEK